MLKHKVSMLGAYAVGKTSLVRQFVDGGFSEKYQTTVGVTIETKRLTLAERELTLVIWDIQGEDDVCRVPVDYVRGSGGCVLVADGTRRGTLDTAVDLRGRVEERLGRIPFVLLLNKDDRTAEWEVDAAAVERLRRQGWDVFRTSAKTGAGVADAFGALARGMLRMHNHVAC